MCSSDLLQRLAAEAVREDGREVVGAPDLARRVPLDGQPRVLRLHAFAVILDADLFLATELDVNDDALRAGVQRVLDQFLDDTGRSFDDLARGDLVRNVVG